MKPLYPLDVNPFLDALSSAQVYTLCSVSLAIGIMIYLAKLLEHRLKTNL